jgi:hypothetical protein
MHTPNNECTSDCRRDGCPENYDWAKEVQLQDMGADRMMKPPRKHHTFIGEADTREETLQSIERENVEASRNQ